MHSSQTSLDKDKRAPLCKSTAVVSLNCLLS